MRYSKWIWLLVASVSVAVAIWRFVKPYEMKVSDGISKLMVDFLITLMIAFFGLFCLLKFVMLNKAAKKRQKMMDDFGNE
jgi:hypothetical protein